MVAASTLLALEASEASSSNVLGRSPDPLGVVTEFAEREVALVAEQSSIAAGDMAMVERQTAVSVISAAQVTQKGSSGGPSLFFGQSVTPDQIGDCSPVSGATVVPILRRSAFLRVLRTIFPHSSIFAFAARRLAEISRHIVETKLGNGVGGAAPATCLLFHECSVAKLRNPANPEAPR